MKEERCSESCRMVNVSPSSPKRTLLVGDQPTQPYRVHGDAVDVGSPGTLQRRAGRVGLVGQAGWPAGPLR